MSLVKFWSRVLFFFILCVAVYAGMKSKPVPQVVPHFDLILHFSVFATLAFLWSVGVAGRLRVWGLFGLLLLGAAIELWQGWQMPARTASLTDMAANTTGVFLGALIYFLLARILPLKF